MVYIERRVVVSCSVYDMLMQKAIGLIDPSNVGVAVGIRQLTLQHSLNCQIYCINMYHNIARFVVYGKKG